jgi:uracil-DNA glycosylase
MKSKDIIYPPYDLIFKVFEIDIQTIKIVLLGQDPYIKKNQAMGLSFSVPLSTTIPPSLWNIFKEIKMEFPERKYVFTHGNLTKWFNNGIFLLNSALTVKEGASNSHQELWAWFTDEVIRYISDNRHNVIFLLLGRNAIYKQHIINKESHNIITGVHPSPLSANNGFFNSGIFKKVETYLNESFDWNN